MRSSFVTTMFAVGLMLGACQKAPQSDPVANPAEARPTTAPATGNSVSLPATPTGAEPMVADPQNAAATVAPTQVHSTASTEDTSAAGVAGEVVRSASVSSPQATADDAMDAVAAALADYLERNGAPADGGVAILGGVNVQFARGLATAAVAPGSAAFSDARNLAFERAFQAALGDLATRRMRRTRSSALSSLGQDTRNQSVLAEACKPNADEALLMKLNQIVDAGMNAALRQLEVPAEDIESVRPQFRCDNPLAIDTIETRVRTTALESLKGVRIVKSVAVGQEVGVVVAVSPNFVATAQAMARGEVSRQPLRTAVEELTQALAAVADEQFFAEYGTRVAKLSNGEMAVYAFGQAGANLSTSDAATFRSAKRRAAQAAALRAAEAQLAQFAKVTTYFAGDDQRFARVAQNLVVSDGVASQEEATEVGRRMMEEVRSVADLRLEGAMTIKRWSLEDPDSGDRLEGVVLAWSPSMAGILRHSTQLARPPGVAGQGSAAQASKRESVEQREDW